MNQLQMILVGYIILMSARNLHFVVFQKIVGVWLFAHTTQHGIYAMLYKHVDWTKLNSMMALHCLNMLVQEVPSLAEHRDFIQLCF